MTAENVDVLILGSGEAGKSLAWSLASAGKSVAVIERKYIGGSCPNIACLPSKNIIHSAKVASYFKRAAEFGIDAPDWKLDMAGVRARKRAMVDGLIQMHLDRYKSTGARLIMGEGRFVAPRTIEVSLNSGGTQLMKGEHVVISTGSRAAIPPIEGLAEAAPLTHIEALELDVVPPHLVVLGGGYVGLELAQAFRRFGSRVSIIDRNKRLTHLEDEDVSHAMSELCAEEGIEVLTSTTVSRITGTSGGKLELQLLSDGVPLKLEGTHLLVASGRTPNTDNLGLQSAGVQLDSNGYIQTDEFLKATAEGVWAVGDCAGSPKFTHIAYDDFRIVRDNIQGGRHSRTGRLVPFCMFTDPELARVGLSEAEATLQGVPYRLAKIPMTTVLRARTLSETRGFMKVLVAADSDRILGFTAFGADAGEVVAVMQLAISTATPYTAVRDSTFTHPTIAEGLTPLLSALPPKSKTVAGR